MKTKRYPVFTRNLKVGDRFYLQEEGGAQYGVLSKEFDGIFMACVEYDRPSRFESYYNIVWLESEPKS